MLKKRLVLTTFISLFFTVSLFSQEKKEEELTFNIWNDLKTSFKYLYQGSYLQFTSPASWAYATTGALSTYYYTKNSQYHDKRISNHLGQKSMASFPKYLGGQASIMLSFPLIPAISYYIAYQKKSLKFKQFAMETFAATYLAMGITSLASYIPFHSRPPEAKTSFWEEEFRGPSSFPSGHVIPGAVLTFKTLQFFGPLWAIIPAVFTYITHYERIHSKKHYPSDTLFGILLSGMASEGVRVAGKYKNNHPIYKAIYERNLQLSLSAHQKVYRLHMAYSF